MVEAGGVSLDVVDVDGPGAQQGCDDGLYERLDWSRIGNRGDWRPGTANDCAAGTILYATVLAFDGDKTKDRPTRIADIFERSASRASAASGRTRSLTWSSR